MKLADLEKVRLLSQRRVKLIEDRRMVAAGDMLLLEITGATEPKTLKVTAMREDGVVKLFEALRDVLLGHYTGVLEEIDAELEKLGVTP